MKNLSSFTILLGLCIILSYYSVSAASSMTEGQDRSVGEEKHIGEIIKQINSLYADLDRSRLPLQKGQENLTQDYNKDDMPPQLIYDEEEAYYLAQCVQNLLYQSGNILSDFYDPQHGLGWGALKTAIYKTLPIEQAWEIEYKVGVTDTKYPDHILTALHDRAAKEGHYLADLIYAEDVEKTMLYLFGIADLNAHVSETYRYYQTGEVFARLGDFGGPYQSYPQITSYEKTADGYICEAVIVQAVNREFPIYAQNSAEDITRENFETETLSCGKFRYTFTKAEDGHLILTAFKTLRTQEPDVEITVVE